MGKGVLPKKGGEKSGMNFDVPRPGKGILGKREEREEVWRCFFEGPN